MECGGYKGNIQVHPCVLTHNLGSIFRNTAKCTVSGPWRNSSWLQEARSPEVEPIAKEPTRAVIFL